MRVDNEEMVEICYGELSQQFNLLITTILTRENPPSFFDRKSLLLVEKNHVGSQNINFKAKCYIYTWTTLAVGERKNNGWQHRT